MVNAWLLLQITMANDPGSLLQGGSTERAAPWTNPAAAGPMLGGFG